MNTEPYCILVHLVKLLKDVGIMVEDVIFRVSGCATVNYGMSNCELCLIDLVRLDPGIIYM